MSTEKRLTPHIEVSIAASLVRRDGSSGQVRIHDISVGGVGLMSPVSLRGGDRFTLQFSLDFNGKPQTIQALTEVRFSTLLANSGEYRVGMRFIELPEAMHDSISRYISSVGDQRRKEQLLKVISGDSWLEKLFTGDPAASTNAGNRNEPRVKVDRKVIIKTDAGATVVGKSVEISESGMGVVLGASLAAKDQCRVFFYLTPDRTKGLIQAVTEVRFCRPQGTGGEKIAGLQFVSFVDNGREILHEYIEQRLEELFEQGALLFRATLSTSAGKGNGAEAKTSSQTEERFVMCPMGMGCSNSLLGEAEGKVVHVCAMTKTCSAYQSRAK